MEEFALHKQNKIGEILMEMSALMPNQLQAALKEQRRTRELLGSVLVRMGFVTEEEVARAVGKQAGIPFIEDPAAAFKPGSAKLLPESLARRVLALPLEATAEGVRVAMIDPLNASDLGDVGYATNSRVLCAISTRERLLDGIEKAYRLGDSLDGALEAVSLDELEVVGGEREAPPKAGQEGFEAPTVKLVNLMILEALRQRASDVHIDPTEKLLRVRFRVDGVLRDVFSPPMRLHRPVISRLKALGGLNSGERRAPQDGRVLIRTRSGKQLDLCVSVVATIFGEKANLRILEQDPSRFEIHRLGMGAPAMKSFLDFISRPNGLILVAGPTGSGKKTTLYSALKSLSGRNQHVITIEDPVVYRLDNVNQIQVDPRAGLTYADGLRACLRQDPNVVLVGEIRDGETAKAAFEAAQTGRLVLSTISSNDAASAISGLLKLGVNPYVAATSLVGILSVRLVRRLCAECRRPTKVSATFSQQLGLRDETLYKPGGCSACRQTGYNGRIAIFEVVPVTPDVQQLIQSRGSLDELHAGMAELDIPSLWADGMEKIVAGSTTLEEVMRVTRSYSLPGD